MLVTFKTAGQANITMFGDVAKDLLTMMGQSGNVPGAIMAEDVSSALAELQTALSNVVEDDAPPPLDDEDNTPSPVALSVRAAPLIDLLESAVASNESVLWESD